MALKSQTFSPYPLKFQPLFQDYLWGGHRLEQQLNKPVGGGICAESWELVDHHSYQSHVINGDLQGLSLSDCLATWQEKMVGPDVWRSIHSAHLPLSLKGRFPLLIKFLDASQNLSVQVHPNDAQAALQIPPDLGKTEAWYVLDRLPQSQIFAGLKPNTNRQTFEKSIRAGQLENCLHSFMPESRDFVFVPAGVQHAIGAGLLILEVQQASNTTFRVFDWNRVDQNGKPRELHLEQALAITDFQMGPVNPVSKPPLIQNERLLISCPYFAVRECLGPKTGHCGFRDRFQIVVCIEGQARIGNEVLRIGETALLPPNSQYYECELSEHTTVIQIWIP